MVKYFFGFLLVVGGLCGVSLSLLGETVVSSSMLFINGLRLSLGIGIFSTVAFLSGMYILVSE